MTIEKKLKSTYPILTDLNGKEYEDTNSCSYGESDASDWEYHPEHVDSEVGLMVDKVLGIWRRIQAMDIGRLHLDYNLRLSEEYKIRL